MRRGLWFVAGAGVGVYAMVRGRRAAEAFTAEGLHDRWQALGLGARMFRDEVAEGKAEAETHLRERFGLAEMDVAGPQRQLASGADTPSIVPGEGFPAHDDNSDDSFKTRNDFEEGPQ